MTAEMTYMYQCPTHVVVDTIDGYVFKGDADGLFDGSRAVAFAMARNMEQNPGFRSYQVFRLVAEASFAPRAEDSERWSCQGCGQVWPVRDSAQIIAQNAKAASVHPGEECRSDELGYAELQVDEQPDEAGYPPVDEVWQPVDAGDVFEGDAGDVFEGDVTE